MDNVFSTIKNMLSKEKKTSNLILIVILLVILLIAMNYIFSEKNDVSKDSKATVSENVKSESNNIETKLCNIISKIAGIEEVSVMVTYSTTEKVIPVYDTKEDVDTTNTEEKTSTKKTTEKTVAYEDSNSGKTAIVESKEQAVASGAIVVAKGIVTDETKDAIKEAVSMVTEVPIHKIQLFINE